MFVVAAITPMGACQVHEYESNDGADKRKYRVARPCLDLLTVRDRHSWHGSTEVDEVVGRRETGRLPGRRSLLAGFCEPSSNH